MLLRDAGVEMTERLDWEGDAKGSESSLSLPSLLLWLCSPSSECAIFFDFERLCPSGGVSAMVAVRVERDDSGGGSVGGCGLYGKVLRRTV